MSFPEIRYCIVCEDARPEVNNTVMVLGLYGVAPDVRMLIKNFEQTIPRLTFLLYGVGGEGQFHVTAHIQDQAGHVWASIPPATLSINRPAGYEGGFFVFQFQGIRFPSTGKYFFFLGVDQEQKYMATFEIPTPPPQRN